MDDALSLSPYMENVCYSVLKKSQNKNNTNLSGPKSVVHMYYQSFSHTRAQQTEINEKHKTKKPECPTPTFRVIQGVRDARSDEISEKLWQQKPKPTPRVPALCIRRPGSLLDTNLLRAASSIRVLSANWLVSAI
jgi:hypothetical protein